MKTKLLYSKLPERTTGEGSIVNSTGTTPGKTEHFWEDCFPERKYLTKIFTYTRSLHPPLIPSPLTNSSFPLSCFWADAYTLKTNKEVAWYQIRTVGPPFISAAHIKLIHCLLITSVPLAFQWFKQSTSIAPEIFPVYQFIFLKFCINFIIWNSYSRCFPSLFGYLFPLLKYLQ